MIVDPVVYGLIVIVFAYLLGSVPTGYLVTKRLTGKDIRQLGSGNAGGNNTWHEVGKGAGAFVGGADFSKGIVAVAVAHWLVDVPLFQPDFFVLGAAVAVIAGQMWPVFLGFRGGNGLGPTFGVVVALLPVEFLVTVALLGLFVLTTRNLVFSANLSMLLLPMTTWIMAEDWRYLVFLGVVFVMLILNFTPTIRKALAKEGSMNNLLGTLFRRGSV